MGHGLTVGPLLAIQYSPKVYITNFLAPATLLGVLMILVQIYDILNIYPIATWSDAGLLNGRFFPATFWGRRAPFAVMAYPLLAVAILFVWAGPPIIGFEGVFAAVWFFAMRFLLATGATCYFLSSSTSLFEMFPSRDERAAVSTFLGGFVLVGAVFGLVFVGRFVLSAQRGSKQETIIFVVVAIASLAMLTGIIPHASVMRKTYMVDPVKSPNVIGALKAIARSPSATNLMVARFLCLGVITTAIGTMPFYLQHACSVSIDDLGMINSLIIGINVITRATMLPVCNWAVRRFNPSRVLVITMVFAVAFGTPFALVAYFTSNWFWLCLLAFLLGFNGSMADIALRVLLGAVIDEDQVTETMKGRESSNDNSFVAPRRDGMFWFVWSMADVISGFYPGVFSVIIGLAGYDGRLDDDGESQPASAVLAITIFFLAVICINYILTAVVMNRFSLKDARLADVQKRYAELFQVMEETALKRRADSQKSVTQEQGATEAPTSEVQVECLGSDGLRAAGDQPGNQPDKPTDVTGRTDVEKRDVTMM
jgi:Na+/melibiose symporter-like transporter